MPKRSEEKAAYYQANKEKMKEQVMRAKMYRKYGITIEEYDAMYADQNGVCAICNQPESLMLRGAIKRLAIDHCHETGKIRGLLCFSCNTALGSFKDDPAIITAALSYLREFSE
jgi:hypothetical protein